ncbi:hypothetical protein H1R20_g977, partial [Candolleomyces eurysporus]
MSWNLDEDFVMAPTMEEQEAEEARDLARKWMDCLALSDSDDSSTGEAPDSDSESQDGGSEDESDGETSNPEHFDPALNCNQTPRQRLNDLLGCNPDWFPWPDRLTCTLDILAHLPRSVFSRKQMDLFLWLLKVNRVAHCPSTRSTNHFFDAIQRLRGIESILYNGALGHRYFVNSLAQILAQEMSNPLVRPKLHFLPEDSGPRLSEARQASHWLHDLPPELTTPCVRIGSQEFFSFEPALLTGDRFVVPVRWFMADGRVHAQCWDLELVETFDGQLWRAVTAPVRVARDDEFLKPYPDLKRDMVEHPELFGSLPVLDIKAAYNPADHVGTQTKIKNARTRTGIKDTFQLHFLKEIFKSYKNCKTNATKTAALKAKLSSLPQDPALMMNPIWRVKGLDAHSDTPVEILHVVLLGFVKYFWRDAIKNQLKDKEPKKELLATRLSCLDYSGSLVGRDFRAIAQVAPFVLKDLPEIEDVDLYMVRTSKFSRLSMLTRFRPT